MSAESQFEKQMERLQRDGVISRAQFLQIMAAAGTFLALGTDKAYAAKSNASGRIVIVGGGAAGISMPSWRVYQLHATCTVSLRGCYAHGRSPPDGV